MFAGAEAEYRADGQVSYGAWWRIPLAREKDPATWIEAGYHLLLLPVGTVTFTLVVTIWSLAVGMILSPIIWRRRGPSRRSKRGSRSRSTAPAT